MMPGILKKFPLFENFLDSEKSILFSYCTKRTFKNGAIVAHSKQVCNALHLIIKGRVEMRPAFFYHFEDSSTTFGPYQFFGEASLLQEQSLYQTDIVAKTNVSCVLLTRSNFLKLLKKHHEIAIKLQLNLCSMMYEVVLNHHSKQTQLSGFGSDYKRKEHDLIGERELFQSAYYGIQTLRALENFNITGIRLSNFPMLIKGLAQVKKAAAEANAELGILDKKIAQAICAACDEIIAGHLNEQFLVDMIQGGAGTSTNMNANEVIANRALELFGYKKGQYDKIHPNNHVNLSQSTNDAYPTAIRLALLQSLPRLKRELKELIDILKKKSFEFSNVLKMGRTQLQDAIPMTLGQEFGAFAATLAEDIDRIAEGEKLFLEMSLGGTAIGTGLNAHPKYAALVTKKLRKITKFKVVLAPNLIEATQDTGAFVLFSGILKRLAVKLSKICNDLRLLSSGPRTGFGDISLPPMQPGSSIMPGKINPVIPEVVNQVAFQVIGNDLTITMAAEGGQLQLNAFEPVIVFNLLQSMSMLERAMHTLGNLCVKDIVANKDACRKSVENSIGLVTALNPLIGYENSTMIAKEALKTGESVFHLVLKHKLLTREKLEHALKPENMLGLVKNKK